MTSKRRRRRRSRSAQPAQARRSRGGWRRTIDSFGGFLTIGAVALGVLVIAVLLFRNPLGFSASDEPLLGEPVALGRATHTDDTPELATTGDPPAGGLHSPVPQRAGIYDGPVPDGNAVHSLEHGMVWITYRPDAVGESELRELIAVAEEFGRDLILSPRPTNESAIAAVSWGRVLRLDAPDAELLRDFITTNRNRSPEPGIR